MAEYTYADVIIDPEDPRVEIGKEYYFGDNPRDVINKANKNKTSLILDSIYKGEINYRPFSFGRNSLDFFSCLIRKKEPEKKYVPFDLSDPEVRKSLRGKWIKNKENHFEICITAFHHQGYVGNTIPADIYMVEDLDADELLKDWIFDDGSPCGKLVEENNV